MHELQLCCLFWRESGWHAYFLFIVFSSGWIRSLDRAVDGELTVSFLLLWILLTNNNPPHLFSLRTISSPPISCDMWWDVLFWVWWYITICSQLLGIGTPFKWQWLTLLVFKASIWSLYQADGYQFSKVWSKLKDGNYW